MKYISIDIETTGLNPKEDQVIEFAAVLEDTLRPDVPVEDLPTFHRLVRHDRLSGTPRVLTMHADLIRELADPAREDDVCRHFQLAYQFHHWCHDVMEGVALNDHGAIAITVAGKNFAAFDQRFLERLPGWEARIEIRRRQIDPAVLYLDPLQDEALPDTATCLRRAELDPTTSHRAVDDARNVIRLIRHYFKNNPR
jgi:DNA polymerase III epsilon subunit-like protein